jgi:hypothetical protein
MLVRFLAKKNIDIKNNMGQRIPAALRPKKTSASVLFSRGKMSTEFFTEDSKLYITPREQKLLRRGAKINRNVKKWDSLSSRIVADFVRFEPSRTSKLLEIWKQRSAMLKEQSEMLNDSFTEVSQNFISQFSRHFSLVRVWNISIVGSVLFGMVVMTFVYRYLGQSASAQQSNQIAAQEQQASQAVKIFGAENISDDAESFTRQVLEIEQVADQQTLEKEIKKMVKGYPIERMAPYIAKKDRTVAAFMVAIARKESSWGVRVPLLNGQDCYNYWGYRGQRNLMGTGGHTCFNSPQDAVDTVAKRMQTLVEKYDNTTPAKMVEPWKCGYNCEATGGRAAANKWVSDVTMYFEKLNEE